MSTGFKIAIAVIILSAAALFYGLRPAPSSDAQTFTTEKKQVEKRIKKADAKTIEAKRHVKRSAKKVEEVTLIAAETEIIYAEIKDTAAPDAEKLAAADTALTACDARADALVDHVDYLNFEISAHEEKEAVMGEERELFSARVDALEAENLTMRRQLFWARVGVVGLLVAGGLGLWALAL